MREAVDCCDPYLLLLYYCCAWLTSLAFHLFQLRTKHRCRISGEFRMASNIQGSESPQQTARPAATKIRIIEDTEAMGETAAAYDFWRAGSGRQQVPGIIKCFGARPDFLQQVVQFSNTIHFSEGHLARRHKEMIASYVSYLNRCPY